jgi:DNA-binding MarR family transcriptional regulator
VSGQRPSPAGLAAWVRFLEAHASITRALSQDLAEHELTLSDFDVLVQIGLGPKEGMRPVEITRAVLLTRSGITRLVSGLADAGLVERVDCPEDARGSLVRLTAAGRAKLRTARKDHLIRVSELFAERFGEAELETLHGLLDRLPGRHEGVPAGAAA